VQGSSRWHRWLLVSVNTSEFSRDTVSLRLGQVACVLEGAGQKVASGWACNTVQAPQCQFPVFCSFCVLEKLHRKYSQNWTKQVPEVLFFLEASRDPKRRWRWATGHPHTRAARPGPWPHPLCVRPPWSTSDNAPSPIKTPRREKPKYPINFLETHRDPPPSST
jgi:hypothetical protein